LSSFTSGEDNQGRSEDPRISKRIAFLLIKRKAYDLILPLNTIRRVSETSESHREVLAEIDCIKRQTTVKSVSTRFFPQRDQPAFATRAVPAWAGDTTSAGRLKARSSASAKATGKAEVRMFTSNCKSRAL